MTRRLPKLAAIVALSLAGAPAAFALDRGDTLGTDAAGITAALQDQGYEVRKVEKDDGYWEVYALKDGNRYEIYVDPKTGAVRKVEQDD